MRRTINNRHTQDCAINKVLRSKASFRWDRAVLHCCGKFKLQRHDATSQLQKKITYSTWFYYGDDVLCKYILHLIKKFHHKEIIIKSLKMRQSSYRKLLCCGGLRWLRNRSCAGCWSFSAFLSIFTHLKRFYLPKKGLNRIYGTFRSRKTQTYWKEKWILRAVKRLMWGGQFNFGHLQESVGPSLAS